MTQASTAEHRPPALAAVLQAEGAHHDVVTWASAYDDWASAWADCPRADWMLAFAAKFGVATPLLVDATSAALQAAFVGTQLEAFLTRLLAQVREGQPSSPSSSHDPAEEGLASIVGLLRELVASPEDADARAAASAAASQAIGLVLAAGNNCASMSIVRYTHAQMASAVRSVLPSPPTLPPGDEKR